MSNINEMDNIEKITAFCPCGVCNRKSACDSECAWFKNYVNAENVKSRMKNNMPFIRAQANRVDGNNAKNVKS